MNISKLTIFAGTVPNFQISRNFGQFRFGVFREISVNLAQGEIGIFLVILGF